MRIRCWTWTVCVEDSKVKPPNEENSKPPDLIVNAGVDDFSGGKNQDNSPVDRRGKKKKKKKAKRVTGLGRRTKEEIVKWNRMTALRFQTWGRHPTFPASLRVSCDTVWHSSYKTAMTYCPGHANDWTDRLTELLMILRYYLLESRQMTGQTNDLSERPDGRTAATNRSRLSTSDVLRNLR